MKLFKSILAVTMLCLAFVPSEAQTIKAVSSLANLVSLNSPDPSVQYIAVLDVVASKGGLFQWVPTSSASTNYSVIQTGFTNQDGTRLPGRYIRVTSDAPPGGAVGQTITITNQIVPDALVVRLTSAAAQTNSSTPTITVSATTVTDGQAIELWGTDDTHIITVQDEGTLTGSKLQLGSTIRSLGKGDVLRLRYNSTDGYWYETGFVNN
jgi:hypothetical protein